MRIVYVMEKISGVGGIERILTEKMNYLAEHTAHEVVLMFLWYDEAEIVYPLSDRIRIVRLNVPYIKGGATYPWLLLRYNRMMKKLQPDVVDLVWVASAFLGAFGMRPRRKDGTLSNVIFESHLSTENMTHGWIFPRMSKRIDCVVTLTEGDAKKYPMAKRVEVIPNFCTLQTDRDPDYSAKKCISLGRDCYQKDFPRMQRLFAEAQKTHPEWTLDIHHNTKDVVSAYTSGSIYLMTSRFEGFPMTLIEAQTCGLPIIAFDCPNGPREIIEDGKTGLLIPYNDDKQFVQKLCYLMDHPEVREQMGRAAREAVKRYNKTEIMNRWLRLFTSRT